jgi:hypothetical protein
VFLSLQIRTRLNALAKAGLCSVIFGCGGCAHLDTQSTNEAFPVISVRAWGGEPSIVPRLAQSIRAVTLHHQGEIWRSGADVPHYLRRLQSWSRNTRGWSDIPYHYVIAPDGVVYEARPWQIAGDTNTEYDPTGHALVMLLGNFEEQTPTAAQWRSTVLLTQQLLVTHGLTVDKVATHRDYTRNTVCPGANFYREIARLRLEIVASLK